MRRGGWFGAPGFIERNATNRKRNAGMILEPVRDYSEKERDKEFTERRNRVTRHFEEVEQSLRGSEYEVYGIFFEQSDHALKKEPVNSNAGIA
jgi:hypothetical protein